MEKLLQEYKNEEKTAKLVIFALAQSKVIYTIQPKSYLPLYNEKMRPVKYFSNIPPPLGKARVV